MNYEELRKEITELRRDFHRHPEAAFEEVRTAGIVANKLRSWGWEVTEGLGKTGVVGVLKNGEGPRIGLRADMDCNCIIETGNLPYSSETQGRMHACGHDGHTAALLGAAKILAEEKPFKGTVILVFQPAEEPGYGAEAMIKDGLFEKFPMDEIYGQHNFTYWPQETMSVCVGPCMAAEDNFFIKIHGKGGHASGPHATKDPLVIGAEIVMALQTIVSRNVDPLKPAVVSCTEFRTDGAHNAIPSNVEIDGDCRSYDPEVSRLIEAKMGRIVKNICEMNDAEYEFKYTREFIATNNDKDCAAIAARAGENIFGKDKVILGGAPLMGSEDFAKYLEHVPGCYAFAGNNNEAKGYNLPNHHAKYDYNDEMLLPVARWFVEIVKLRMA